MGECVIGGGEKSCADQWGKTRDSRGGLIIKGLCCCTSRDVHMWLMRICEEYEERHIYEMRCAISHGAG